MTIPFVKLAPPSRQPLLNRRQAAEFLGVTVAALEKRAHRRQGPIFYRRGWTAQARAAYRIEDLESATAGNVTA